MSDREGWLSTFAPDATREDPVGEGTRRGHEEIGTFWDGVDIFTFNEVPLITAVRAYWDRDVRVRTLDRP
ncbi:MAG: hypothetical protein H0W70_08505 [Actinobacteria bacterium]|nr:hypothetical protein [Actinomycetota bacterium]